MKLQLSFSASMSACIAALLFTASLAAELPSEVERVLERNIEAMGGRDKIASIKSTRLVGSFTIPSMGMTGKTTLVHVYPDKVYAKQELPGMGEMIQASSGDEGWAMDPMQGFRQLSEPELASLKQNESLRELLDFDEAYSSGSVEGEAEVAGEPMTVLKLVNADTDLEETHFYSKEDGLLKKVETTADMGDMGSMPATMRITGYEEQDGIRFPSSMEVVNAGMTIELAFTSLEIDPEIDPSLFQAPQ